MCDDWIICSYVTILVEMKPEYRVLKGNQGTMVHMHLYASVLNWYDVWWLNYMFITILVEMKLEDWNEIKVSWLHIHLHVLVWLTWYDMYYDW